VYKQNYVLINAVLAGVALNRRLNFETVKLKVKVFFDNSDSVTLTLTVTICVTRIHSQY